MITSIRHTINDVKEIAPSLKNLDVPKACLKERIEHKEDMLEWIWESFN